MYETNPTGRGRFSRAVLSAPLLALLAFSGCGDAAAGPKTLRFTAIPDADPTALRAKFEPVAAYLAEQLGIAVEYVPVTRYADSVELFKSGDVQLAWFGGLSGVQARHAVSGAQAIAQGAADPNFHSYFIAHRDTGLERSDSFPAGLGELKFTFGSEDSTSGRLMPEHFIRKHTGKSPAEFFGAPNAYSGSHDKTIEQVAAGTYQAGAVNYKRYDRFVAEGRIDPDVCRIVWKTPPYADYNLTAHPSIDETFGAGTTAKIQEVLLAMTDPTLLAAFERERLIAAKNEDFAQIRELALELDFVRQ